MLLGEPSHTPLLHWSFAVQGIPSSHDPPVTPLCTQEPEEQESVVQSLLSSHSAAELQLTHWFRDTLQDCPLGQFSVPLQVPEAHVSPDVQSMPSSQRPV